ncbi:hypothetical protein, partial [Aliikangiella maris]
MSQSPLSASAGKHSKPRVKLFNGYMNIQVDGVTPLEANAIFIKPNVNRQLAGYLGGKQNNPSDYARIRKAIEKIVVTARNPQSLQKGFDHMERATHILEGYYFHFRLNKFGSGGIFIDDILYLGVDANRQTNVKSKNGFYLV